MFPFNFIEKSLFSLLYYSPIQNEAESTSQSGSLSVKVSSSLNPRPGDLLLSVTGSGSEPEAPRGSRDVHKVISKENNNTSRSVSDSDERTIGCCRYK